MLIKSPNKILPSEITPETTYHNRRQFLQQLIATSATLAISNLVQAKGVLPPTPDTSYLKTLPHIKNHPLSTDESPTPLAKIISYSNFYEFGTQKSDPITHAHQLQISPWQLIVVGEVEKPEIIDIDDLLQKFTLEERIYRLRCVEGWSMVIPWLGIPLNEILKRVQPTSKAKFVQFHSRFDPQQMPAQQQHVLNWPYTEGLRIDEAMHPLTILSVGLYGNTLPKENGAPVRLVVPWKYGFKSIKSLVKIRLVERQPLTSWEEAAPTGYGFYSNVNPKVPHPRWSQAKERRIGELTKRKTLMFNGYADQVATLYQGMDLKKYF